MTRARFNAYTRVRAGAATSESFVNTDACSASPLKDHEVTMARLGKMKLEVITPFLPGSLAVEVVDRDDQRLIAELPIDRLEGF